jgi:hypothetical protein
MPSVYIKAPSKKALNEDIAAGKKLDTVEYNMFSGDKYAKLEDYPTGTQVKIWDKRDFAGTPIAKSYGTWNKEKNKIL